MAALSEENRRHFLDVCYEIIGKERQENGIGTLSEKTLHAILKRYCEENTENHEIKVGRYVADIVNDDKIIEIQTRQFNKLRGKLTQFLKTYDVTVVYPIAEVKWICWIDKETGEITKKRKSPKKGSAYDAFYELYKIKMFLDNPNLHFKFLFFELIEYRYLDGWSKDGKKGSTRYDRVPNDILGELNINTFSDYEKLVPDDLISPFTAKDYAAKSKLNIRYAQTALNVLNHVGTVERIGKIGNAYLYKRSKED